MAMKAHQQYAIHLFWISQYVLSLLPSTLFILIQIHQYDIVLTLHDDNKAEDSCNMAYGWKSVAHTKTDASHNNRR